MLHTNNKGMLAGVCSRLATWLGWNVWAIRIVLLILLIAQPVWTALGYAAAALLQAVLTRGTQVFSNKSEPAGEFEGELQSPELTARKRRIDDLEQRFRDWEQSLPKDKVSSE